MAASNTHEIRMLFVIHTYVLLHVSYDIYLRYKRGSHLKLQFLKHGSMTDSLNRV